MRIRFGNDSRTNFKAVAPSTATETLRPREPKNKISICATSSLSSTMSKRASRISLSDLRAFRKIFQPQTCQVFETGEVYGGRDSITNLGLWRGDHVRRINDSDDDRDHTRFRVVEHLSRA